MTCHAKVLSQRSKKPIGIHDFKQDSDLTEDDYNYRRPENYSECIEATLGTEIPCPFVFCKWHLYLDVTAHGSIHFNQPDIDPTEMAHTCVMAVVRQHPDGAPPDLIGQNLGMTRQGAQLIEKIAAARAKMELVQLRLSKDDLAPSEDFEDVYTDE